MEGRQQLDHHPYPLGWKQNSVNPVPGFLQAVNLLVRLHSGCRGWWGQDPLGTGGYSGVLLTRVCHQMLKAKPCDFWASLPSR